MSCLMHVTYASGDPRNDVTFPSPKPSLGPFPLKLEPYDLDVTGFRLGLGP